MLALSALVARDLGSGAPSGTAEPRSDRIAIMSDHPDLLSAAAGRPGEQVTATSIRPAVYRLLARYRRLATYVAVGLTSFTVQFVVLAILVRLSAYRPVANGAAFAISAQVNFVLSSRFTWGDRRASGRREIALRWAAYNSLALASLGCDTAVFVLSYRAIGTAPAALLGVAVVTCMVYLVCNTLIFGRGRRTRTSGRAAAAR
jgi:putative flippase GtrA